MSILAPEEKVVRRPGIIYDNDAIELTIDLTKARSFPGEEVWEKFGHEAHSLHIRRCDSTAYIRINSPFSNAILCETGLSLQFMRIRRVYVQNPSGAGELVILLTFYNPDIEVFR